MPDEFKYPHEWAREEDGSIDYVELGEQHGGPYCLRCGLSFCQHCVPNIFTEACDDQDAELFALPFTKTQMNARLRHLKRLGYIVRSGMIIGQREPIERCKPEDHVWAPKTRRETGSGPYKRVYKTESCVKCYEVRAK